MILLLVQNHVAMEADVGLMKIGQLFRKKNHCFNTSELLLNVIILMLTIIYYEMHDILLYLISTYFGHVLSQRV